MHGATWHDMKLVFGFSNFNKIPKHQGELQQTARHRKFPCFPRQLQQPSFQPIVCENIINEIESGVHAENTGRTQKLQIDTREKSPSHENLATIDLPWLQKTVFNTPCMWCGCLFFLSLVFSLALRCLSRSLLISLTLRPRRSHFQKVLGIILKYQDVWEWGRSHSLKVVEIPMGYHDFWERGRSHVLKVTKIMIVIVYCCRTRFRHIQHIVIFENEISIFLKTTPMASPKVVNILGVVLCFCRTRFQHL